MPEAAPIAKKRGRPKKTVSVPEVEIPSGSVQTANFPTIDWAKQEIFGLGSDLLKIIITARQGKANATAAEDAYKMAKQLRDYIYVAAPVKPVDLPSKNLSAENLNALEWDPNDDGA